jgi:hypothetical protein
MGDAPRGTGRISMSTAALNRAAAAIFFALVIISPFLFDLTAR